MLLLDLLSREPGPESLQPGLVPARGHAGIIGSDAVFYLVTSLSAEQASPAEMAAWARGHWSIEAVHHIRDRTMDEDRHTVRTKNAAQNWATVRDTTISALRLAGYTNIKMAGRATAADPGLVLQTIALTSPNTLTQRL